MQHSCAVHRHKRQCGQAQQPLAPLFPSVCRHRFNCPLPLRMTPAFQLPHLHSHLRWLGFHQAVSREGLMDAESLCSISECLPFAFTPPAVIWSDTLVFIPSVILSELFRRCSLTFWHRTSMGRSLGSAQFPCLKAVCFSLFRCRRKNVFIIQVW